MKVSAVQKGSKEVWRVYLGTFEGRKRYKQFKRKGDADLFVKHEGTRRKSHGRISADLDPSRIVEWLELDKMARDAGGTLREATLEYVRRLGSTRSSIPVSEAVEMYLAAKIAELSPYTFTDRRNRLRTFAADAPDLLISEIAPKPFLDKLAKRTSRTNADNSRRSISAFYTWAVNSGYAGENPIKKIGAYTSKKGGVATVLSSDEAAGLLATIQNQFDLEVAGFVLLSLFAGIRPLEFRKRIISDGNRRTVMLDWSDLMDGYIRISTDLSKTGAPRLVPINDTLQSWLDWLKEAAGGELKGPVVGSRFKFTWADWKNKNANHLPWSAKDILRHSYGTYRVSQAQEIGRVAIEMGNSEAVVRRHYWNALRSQNEAQGFWSLTP